MGNLSVQNGLGHFLEDDAADEFGFGGREAVADHAMPCGDGERQRALLKSRSLEY